MKVSIVTLGCKVNQFESQALETLLSERGHSIVSEESAADVCIINTCAVTAESGRKSRQAARRAPENNKKAPHHPAGGEALVFLFMVCRSGQCTPPLPLPG